MKKKVKSVIIRALTQNDPIEFKQIEERKLIEVMLKEVITNNLSPSSRINHVIQPQALQRKSSKQQRQLAILLCKLGQNQPNLEDLQLAN